MILNIKTSNITVAKSSVMCYHSLYQKQMFIIDEQEILHEGRQKFLYHRQKCFT